MHHLLSSINTTTSFFPQQPASTLLLLRQYHLVAAAPQLSPDSFRSKNVVTIRSHLKRIATCTSSISDAIAISEPNTAPQLQRRYYHPNIWADEVGNVLPIHHTQISLDTEFELQIQSVRKKLASLDDGETSPSAYDTAWVARVPALDGSAGPQFPQTIDWIIQSQLYDGSWGEESYFLAYDRILNTLSCIVALKTWNVGQDNVKRGVDFLSCNMAKLEEEASAHMPCGFEIVFIPLLQEAKRLGLPLAYEAAYITKITHTRANKLKRIPLELLHTRPTTLLYSLEGLEELVDWERILKLQFKDGSFLTSPASTACALIHTRDSKCLDYLTTTLASFKDEAVPCQYPIDLFERLWLVDTIERLGISRFFQNEIKDILHYVYRYWTPQGIGWGRHNLVQDIDDTAMAFRLLRLHGYNVSADVFEHFKQDGKFVCFPYERHHGVSEMFNLYRASQVRYQDETVLEEAERYAKTYLIKALETDDFQDKWSLKKDLLGEVSHGLRYSFYRSYPRIDARVYLDQYGADDVWIAKNIYRLPSVNCQTLYDLAKTDFRRCQEIHKKEIQEISRWWEDSGFSNWSYVRQRPVEIYFSGTASMFEPEFGVLRMAYTKVASLVLIMDDFFDNPRGSFEELGMFLEAIRRWDPSLVSDLSDDIRSFFMLVYGTVSDLIRHASQLQGRDVGDYIKRAWETYTATQYKEAVWTATNHTPNLQEYIENARYSIAIGCILMNSLLFCGEIVTEEMLQQIDDRSNLFRLVCESCRLSNDLQTFAIEKMCGEQASAITCYMADHPGVSEEDAVAFVEAWNRRTLIELTREFTRQDNIAPDACKRVALALTRSMQIFYIDDDGFTNSKEYMKELVGKVFFEPLK